MATLTEPSSDPDTRRVLDALRRIVRDLRHTAHPSADAWIGPARLFALQQLAEHGPLGVSDLAALTHTSAPSVSVVVQHLVEAGYVARDRDPSDRRRQLLALTKAGKVALRRAPPAAQHHLVAAIGALSATRRRTLASLLELLTPGGSPAPLFFEEPRTVRS